MSSITNDNLQSDNSCDLTGLARQDAISLVNLEAVMKNYRGDDISRNALQYEIGGLYQGGGLQRIPPETFGNFLKADDVAFGLIEFLKQLPKYLAVEIKDVVIDVLFKDDFGPLPTISRELLLGRLALLSMWFDGTDKSMLQLATLSNRVTASSGWDKVSPYDLANTLRGEAFDQGRIFALSYLPSSLFSKTTILSQCFCIRDQIDRIFPRLSSEEIPSDEAFEIVFPGAGSMARRGIIENDRTAYEYLHSLTCIGNWDLMYQKEPESWITVRFCEQSSAFTIQEVIIVEKKWREGIKALVLARKSIIDEEISRISCEVSS